MKLESWDKGNLRNFVYIRFHEIQEITRFILYKKAYSVKMFKNSETRKKFWELDWDIFKKLWELKGSRGYL